MEEDSIAEYEEALLKFDPAELCTNLDATQVIQTGEHADGCRVDAHAFYHQQQLNELKRLQGIRARTVLELASNASTSLETATAFFNVGALPEHNVLQPFEEIPTTSGQSA
ncbi:hypothetical protein T02_16351 [Trichinella nativa]|uniref:Uncharacterized protein n=1 Tax=Trichinella nativa TaxID=6335 RepID=A0A0V1KPK6_9BILA|nr:hypothetical protein T02_16351 [Trichinella nativa]